MLIWAFFSVLIISLMLSMKSFYGNAALMPAYLLISILFGIGFSRFEKIFFGIKSMSGVHAVLFLYLTATAQFALMTYCPVKFIP